MAITATQNIVMQRLVNGGYLMYHPYTVGRHSQKPYWFFNKDLKHVSDRTIQALNKKGMVKIVYVGVNLFNTKCVAASLKAVKNNG